MKNDLYASPCYKDVQKRNEWIRQDWPQAILGRLCRSPARHEQKSAPCGRVLLPPIGEEIWKDLTCHSQERIESPPFSGFQEKRLKEELQARHLSPEIPATTRPRAL